MCEPPSQWRCVRGLTDEEQQVSLPGPARVDRETSPPTLGGPGGDRHRASRAGSQFDDALYGNSVANRIEGGSGADLLYGYDGNDTLYGGNFGDRLCGRSDLTSSCDRRGTGLQGGSAGRLERGATE